ncbi:MAG: MATE family efflux transporter [Spirochaetaceae bacterium]|nr:MATE family efflux transporter [Spirochaetaceae bacterium]
MSEEMTGTFREVPGMFDGALRSLYVRLAAPIFMGMVFNILYTTVDTLFISAIDRSNPAIIGGTGLIFPVVFVAISLSSGVMIGVSSLVARAMGERNRKVLNRVADSGLALASVLGILMVVLGYVFADWFVITFMGADAQYARYAQEYLRWILPGLGLMKYMMVTMITGNLLNIILDRFFILENVGPLRGLGMGVSGAALATVVGQSLAILYLVWAFLAGKTTVPIAWKFRDVRLPIIGQIVVVGLPGALSQMLLAITFVVINRVLIEIDPRSVTAATLCGRIDQIIILPLLALSTAQLTIVGQNIGRGNLLRARSAWRTGAVMAVIVTAFSATLMVILAPFIYRAFTSDSTVLSYTIRQTRMVEYSFLFAAMAMMARSVIQAVGRPWPGLVITGMRMLGFVVPFIYLFVYGFDWGIYGVWGGMIAGNVLGAFLSLGWVGRLWDRIVKGELAYRHT